MIFQMKKILILTKEYQHPKVSSSGGTGIFYKNLAQELQKKGFEVVVFGANKKAVSLFDGVVRVHFVQDYFKKYKIQELLRSLTGKFSFLKKIHQKFYLQEKTYLRSELQKLFLAHSFTPDIIETHDWEGISLSLVGIKIPYVIRCHGSWTVLENEFGYKKVAQGKKYCEKLAFEKSRFNIVISEFSQKVNQKYFNLVNPRLIYNGIDNDFFKPELTEKIPNSIFYFGNLSIEKGIETTFRAFAKVKEVITDALLHCIGNTNGYDGRLSEFLPENCHSSVNFHGQKNKTEIRMLLSKAELVFFPSKGENFSLSLLEAMALQSTVIVSAIPAFAEIIKPQENGCIAQSEDDFSQKAIDLFKNKIEAKYLGENARKTIEEKFTTNKMLIETLQYYQKIYEEF